MKSKKIQRFRFTTIILAIVPAVAPLYGQTAAAQEAGGGLVIRPADSEASPLGDVAPSPTSQQAVSAREQPGPMITPGADFEHGHYRGVVPGSNVIPPKAQRLAKTRRNFVTWPGFELTSSGSRIFVQSTRPLEYRRADEGNRIVLVFSKARIHLRNNRNPLVTEHFNTPVARAYLRHRGNSTHLIIVMKVGSSPSIHQVSEGDYHFLFLEFPGGNYPIPEEMREAPVQRNEERLDIDYSGAQRGPEE